MSDVCRRVAGEPLPTPSTPAPVPTVERIPRTFDGCTWYAYAHDESGERIGVTARTKRDALARFPEHWAMFA